MPAQGSPKPPKPNQSVGFAGAERGTDGRVLSPKRPNAFVTIKDVAAHAGVSVATVSRAINNNGYVAADAKARVLAAMKKLGFRPSQRARSMRSSRTMTIGAVVSELVNLVHLEFLRGVDEAASEKGYVVLVATSQGSPEKEREIFQRMVAERTDGVVVGTLVGGQRNIDILADHNIPVVPPPGPLARQLNATWIAKEIAATREMAERLVTLGHRHVAFVTARGVSGIRTPSFYRKARFEVLVDCFSENGVEFDVVDIRRNAAVSEMAVEVVKATRAPSAPTAWVAATHLVLPSLLTGLRMADLDIPKDVSVVSYGDSPWARAYRPPIAVVGHDISTEARALTSMLLGWIDGQPPDATQVEYRTRFIERQSIGPTRLRPPKLSRSLEPSRTRPVPASSSRS
jgi:LacI family transcriptional regulator